LKIREIQVNNNEFLIDTII